MSVSAEMRVVEISYSVPPEVFIRRHVEALQGVADLDLMLVGRSLVRAGEAASVAQGPLRPCERLMPNFDHLNSARKIWGLRYAVRREAWRKALKLRDRAVLGFFASLRPDLIHFHMAGLAVLMRWIPQTLGIPYTVSLRGSDIQVAPLMSGSWRSALRDALAEAAAIHSVCDHLANLARGLGIATPIATIYTTVPLPEDLPPYPPTNGSYKFLAVGRLHWTKNLPCLLIAFRELLDRGLRAELKIIGSGPDEPAVRYWVHALGLHEWVTLAGRLDEQEILRELSSAHAYVQSSVAEGFSNCLAEAMAWGCPVFATDAGGTPELVSDGVSGVLLPLRAFRNWPDRLALVLHRDLMLSVRLVAHGIANQSFSSANHAHGFQQFYRLASAHARGSRPSSE